jgi:hypothetical protein
LLAVTARPDLVMAAFQELVMLSAESANEKPVFHPVMGAFPLSVTVNWTWYPPDHEVTTEEVRVQAPAGVLPVGLGEGLADGLEVALGDGLGDPPPALDV